MFKSRVATGALVAGAVTLASLFAAAPANAATLPAGQRIDTVEYYDHSAYTADPATAVLTPVNETDSSNGNIIHGIDVDDDGHGYAVGSGGLGALVYPFDANTGIVGAPLGVDILFEGGAIPSDQCTGVDLTNGVLYAICYGDIEDDYTAFIGVLTLSAGEDTWELDPFVIDDITDFTAIAVDPKTGIIYGFTAESAAYTLTQDLGAVFLIDMDWTAWGADFDRDGQLWVTSYRAGDSEPYSPTLGIVDLATGAVTAPSGSGDPAFYSLNGEIGPYQSESITVWGKAALPATGPADTSVPLVGAALLLLAGTLLAAGTAFRRRTETA